MSATPFSSAAANASAHACSRHAHILGPRYCTECRAPLCTACARTGPHRSCPSCNVAAGRPASQPDVGWFVVLFADGLVHALSTVKRRLLPFAIGISMLGVATVISAEASLGRLFFRRSLGDEMGPLALGGLALATLFGLWTQPGLSIPTVTRVGFWRGTLRSLVSGALVGGATLAALTFGVALVLAGDNADSALLLLGGVLVCIAAGFVIFFFSATFLPIQAAYAVGRRSLFGALKLPFTAGPAAFAMLLLTWFMMMGTLYMGTYALLLPAIFVTILNQWLGVLLGVLFGSAGYVLLLLVTGAYSSASLRLCEDRAALRAKA